MNLDLAVAVLVARGGVLPDDVLVVEPVDGLSEQHGGRVDDEPASASSRLVAGARPSRHAGERDGEREDHAACPPNRVSGGPVRGLTSRREHDLPYPPMCRDSEWECDRTSAPDLQ